MATPQLSPGVLTREVDLTVGRAENVLDNIGGIAGPFSIGPIDEAIDIVTEQDLINVFGKPISTDTQYEYWLSASSYLSYGGVLKVVRTDGSTLRNSNAGVGAANTSVKIKNYDDYNSNFSSASNFNFAAKTPGTWANGLKICFIDDLGDQIIGIATTSLSGIGVTVGNGVYSDISGTSIALDGSVSTFDGILNAIITGVSTDAVNGNSTVTIKIVSRTTTGGITSSVSYARGNSAASFASNEAVTFVGSGRASETVVTATDWYDEQTLGLTNSVIYWKSIAPKPSTNGYVLNRSGRNDSLHIAIVDDSGSITGIKGNILEKHVNLSKAFDAVSEVNSPQKIYYKNFLSNYSSYIYAGANPSAAEDAYTGTVPRPTAFSSGYTKLSTSDGLWGQSSQGTTFSTIGNVTYNLTGGVDYGANGGMQATLGDLMTSYNLFANKDALEVDYLICGPGLTNEFDSQAKANKLIAIATGRKDCLAVISPHRANVVDVLNADTQTNNIIKFFSPISSSSYAVFDSGYKYMYDRFNNAFRYVPCNADVAGLMMRVNINSYPWFSPAGQQRGILNNAIKLAYNPTKPQRDQLYTQRVNPIITQPGLGILLFGDKTGLGYASAFDRINVRRLFLTIEQALERAAQAQLFEFNDSITRSNFVNIVEPYLRDVQSKRGLYDFLVICDESNNTPDVIDNNEFRADIFIKPAKSINYVTLTFVATRTGISFDEVAGRV
jgi:hypothetical protein